MASRKVLAVSTLIVALTALPAAAGTHEVDFWNGLWQRVVALLVGGDDANGGLVNPAETTTDDLEYYPSTPGGG
jgi:hypothetical protein